MSFPAHAAENLPIRLKGFGMPLYEYVCKDCGHHFDALRSMKDADTLILCKSCHGENTNRALSVFFSSSEGRSIAGSGGSGCGGCSGGSCSSCGHH
jgi:putative FmdB family regulatory protein